MGFMLSAVYLHAWAQLLRNFEGLLLWIMAEGSWQALKETFT